MMLLINIHFLVHPILDMQIHGLADLLQDRVKNTPQESIEWSVSLENVMKIF